MSYRRLAAVVAVTALIACSPEAAPAPDAGPLEAGAQCHADSDCDTGLFCDGVPRCLPGGPSSDARGCVRLAHGPCIAGQTCSEASRRCVTDCAVGHDADGDGFPSMDCGGTDCDDGDASRHPGATEVCDVANVDEDCDPTTFGFRDSDHDGAADAHCCNGTGASAHCGTDCDDNAPGVSPTATEVCNHIDDDCDTAIDEMVATMLYPDADMDGAGDAHAAPVTGCGGMTGLVANHDDCNDMCSACNPGAPEICDTRDNDCDGTVDEMTVPIPWYVDADGDTYGDESMPTMLSCSAIAGYAVRGGDCDDMRADAHPFATEICNDVDDDCSTGGGAITTEDADMDMHSPPMASCTGGFPKDDCDDTMATVHPGASELCNDLDDDCSTGGGAITTEDADMDGHAPTTGVCSGGSLPADDCNDTMASVHPGATELCDGTDSNCSSGGGMAADEDADGDHYSAPSAPCTGGYPKTDCDDAHSSVHPGAAEICDGLDNGCTGSIDSGCPTGIASGAMTSMALWPSTCGGTTGTTTCPAGQAATAISFYTIGGPPYTVAAFAIWCSTLTATASGAPGAPYSYPITVGAPVRASSVASGTGTTAPRGTATCPAGSIATGVTFVSSVAQLECRPIGTSGGSAPGSYVVTLGAPTLVGSGVRIATAATDVHCASGAAIVSTTGKNCGGALQALSVACAPLTVAP